MFLMGFHDICRWTLTALSAIAPSAIKSISRDHHLYITVTQHHIKSIKTDWKKIIASFFAFVASHTNGQLSFIDEWQERKGKKKSFFFQSISHQEKSLKKPYKTVAQTQSYLRKVQDLTMIFFVIVPQHTCNEKKKKKENISEFFKLFSPTLSWRFNKIFIQI